MDQPKKKKKVHIALVWKKGHLGYHGMNKLLYFYKQIKNTVLE